jgi:hypothetical protein
MTRFPLVLLLLFPVSLVLSQTPASPPKQILFDFRSDKRTPPPKISPSIQRSVLSKVFRRYLTDQNRCRSDFGASGNDYLAAARRAGQFVPSIVDTTNGSFTAAGQTQTAYLISVGECNASHADNFGSKRLAIFAGPQLLVDLDIDFNSRILRKTDLNGDGIDELLLSASDMAQGILVETATLFTFQNGKAAVIEDFGQVSEDSCASGMPGSGVKAAMISITTASGARMPKLKIDNYESACRNVKRWRFVSAGKNAQ